MATYENQFDFLTRGPHAPFVRETRSAGTQPIHIVHSAQPEGDFSDPAHSEMVLIQILGSKAPTTCDFGAGRIRHPFRYGDFELQPPNVATSILAEGDHEVRGFILPFGRIRDVLGDKRHGSNGDFGHLHATPFRDFFLERLCERLWEECEWGNPNGDLFADTALAMIAVTLSGLAGESDRLSGGRLGEVGDWIVEYIDVHLDQSIVLDDLATLSNMPETQFLAAFKAKFGTTPHQYVLSRRIARAQELLAPGEMPLAEIAYTCGFASQSHMTDVFRSKLGVTPGRYRKVVRG